MTEALRLEETPTEKLYELIKLLEKHPGKLEDWTDDLREDLIDIIADDITNEGYNGENNYDSMYWFMKGKQLAEPQTPERYIDSDEYLFKDFDKKREEQLKEDSLLMRLKIENERLNNKYNQVKEQNKELLKQLPKHAHNLREFHSTRFHDEADDYFEPKDLNKNLIHSYQEWLANNDESHQIELVNEIMNRLESNPTKWEIDFESLTNKGKKALFPKLKKFFEKFIDTLVIIKVYKIYYKVNGEWKAKELTPEVYRNLMKNFNEENFLFNIDDKPHEYFYEKQSMEMPEWSLFSAIRFEEMKIVDSNNDRGGKFFRYVTKNVPPKVVEYLKRLQIFDRLDTHKVKHCDEEKVEKAITKIKRIQRKELNDCCFIYALQQTGEYAEEELNKIRLRINTRYLTHSAIEHLCQEFKINLKIIYIDEGANGKNKKKQIEKHKKGQKGKNYMGVPENEALHKHTFNLFDKHYFIEERTPFTSYYIEHIDELSEDCYNKTFNKAKNKMVIDNSPSRFITSSNLVRSLMKSNHFTPITFGQYGILTTIYTDELDKDLDFSLEYDKESCTRLIAPLDVKTNKNEKPKTIWYCDFEADVSGKYHKPFMCVLQSVTGDINKEFHGEDCNKQLLDFLPDNSMVFYHNLAYDIRMIAHYGLNKSIIKGSKFMSGNIKYNDKTIYLKDTLPMLSCKLSQLPQCFNLPETQKEIFPYKYYTLDRLKENKGVINEAGVLEDKLWTTEDYKLFNENIDKIPGCRIDAHHFDMWKYASFYCQQDVTILRLGYNTFREGFIKDFNIDPFNYISISSLANEVFNQRVYYPNRNLYKVGGVIRQFCSKAVHGGRCMCAYNKKWHIRKPLCDFDAVSLYPSAMARLYTVEGRPKVIQPEQLNLEFLSKQSAYVVKIIITKVNKHFAFPLIMRKINGLNLNDDNLKEGETVTMYVDNIELEDLINFQKIEFEFVKGYYWSGKRDYSIQKEIRNIFNKRLEYKKQKNPLQQLYKLIMNSCYGKTIEKPVDKDYKYIYDGEQLYKYWCKNHEKIIEDTELEQCNDNNQKLHAIKTIRPIDKHFNFILLGIQVLSMSKRIMNEVMCLAFDIGCHIYYQDTDSMHIEVDDLPKLVEAYREKYNRELIGENLGQFHSDFTSDTGRSDVKHADESIFLMKKMYIDKLKMSDNTHEYMIRGKGLTLNSIKHEYKNHFHNDPMELYKHLYNGNNVIFDLTRGQPMFKMNPNMTVNTIKNFKRKIKVTYEEGNRESYFGTLSLKDHLDPFAPKELNEVSSF